MHHNSPYVVPGRTFGQGGCHTANSSAREGAYMSTPTPVEPAPVHFPQVRVSDKEGVYSFVWKTERAYLFLAWRVVPLLLL